jgi:hypothetical protein
MSVEVDEMTLESSHRVRSAFLILVVIAMITLGLKYLTGEKA